MVIVHSHVQLQPCLITIGYIQCLTALTVCLADVFCRLQGLSMIDINNNNHDNSNRRGRHRHRYRHRYRHRPLHLHSAQFLIKFSDFVTWRTSFPKLALHTQVGMWVMRRTLQNGRTPRTCGAQKMHVFAIVCLFLKSNRPVSIFLDRKSFASLFRTVFAL